MSGSLTVILSPFEPGEGPGGRGDKVGFSWGKNPWFVICANFCFEYFHYADFKLLDDVFTWGGAHTACSQEPVQAGFARWGSAAINPYSNSVAHLYLFYWFFQVISLMVLFKGKWNFVKFTN